MTRASAQPSKGMSNREFPYRVELPADSIRGHVIEEVGVFHRDRGVHVRYRSVRRGDQWYSVYCFGRRELAETFHTMFGGELLDRSE